MLKKHKVAILILSVIGLSAYFAMSYGFGVKIFRTYEAGVEPKETSSELKVISATTSDTSLKSNLQKVVFKIESVEEIDEKIEEYLRGVFPIISDGAIDDIKAAKYINKFLVDDSLGVVEFYANFYVPKNYLDESPKILWELNIAAFESKIFQIYDGDTILVDIWPNVVGKASTKTYTGLYEAFRLRNWPWWKDPEAADSVRPTPPGPGNPLGLFVVHYDENSLRYFHGTNKNYLLKNEYRALSHGCVRNLNENIARMKRFIIKKVVKSEDLSFWLNSKQSMTFEMKGEDRFPVRIIYKTFDIRTDSSGDYIIFYNDVYNYDKGAKLSEFDNPELITLTTVDNVLYELKLKRTTLYIPDERVIPIIENLLSNYSYNKKYYFEDLIKGQSTSGY